MGFYFSIVCSVCVCVLYVRCALKILTILICTCYVRLIVSCCGIWLDIVFTLLLQVKVISLNCFLPEFFELGPHGFHLSHVCSKFQTRTDTWTQRHQRVWVGFLDLYGFCWIGPALPKPGYFLGSNVWMRNKQKKFGIGFDMWLDDRFANKLPPFFR